MEENHLTVQRTARYYTIGQLTERTHSLWFCLHGFGQLAQFFGRKFTGLANDETLIVVPEGLSRLYLNGDYQRVGASWLTREDKAHEITDFVAYLNTLYTLVLDGRDPAGLHTTVLGFSQGAATACRWLSDPDGIQADRLILWAGYFPNGLSELIDPARLAQVETHYVYGTDDEYFKDFNDVDAYLRRIQNDLPNLRMTSFPGGHRVEMNVLKSLIES